MASLGTAGQLRKGNLAESLVGFDPRQSAVEVSCG